MLKLIKDFNLKDKKKLLAALRYVISDFKSVEKKFLDQGISEERVKKYLADFKLLRDQQKIKNDNEKNIDYWGKKPFEDLVAFLDELKGLPTILRQLKQKNIKGADLITENDNWYVYRITTYEASKFLGDETGWCIKHENHWQSYYKDADFYFFISKNRTDKWKKIALQLKSDGSKTYWDVEDKAHSSVSSDLKLPNLDVKFSGRIQVGKKWCSPCQLEELPEYTTLDSLRVKDIPNLKKLPEHLTIKNTLDLRGSNLEKLPNNLNVHRLILGNSKIKELPKNATYSIIDLEDSNVETLPDNLRVEEEIYLNSKITKLPKNLKVGVLNFKNTNIEEIPSDLKADRIYLEKSKIKKLPKDFECYDIEGIENLEDLNNLPEGLITGELDLSDLPISKLPLTLYAHRLNISNTAIKQLPKNNKYDALKIANTKIETLPDDFIVEDVLDIRKTPITKLPSKLKVGTLYLNEKVTELPEDLNVTEKIIVKENQLKTIPDALVKKIREIY